MEESETKNSHFVKILSNCVIKAVSVFKGFGVQSRKMSQVTKNGIIKILSVFLRIWYNKDVIIWVPI